MYKAGDNLGGCRLLKECGSGAFGSVFLAENETTGQRAALKILPKTGRHWNKELAALAAYQEKCRHANLMRIYHIGQNEDCIFYTMDAADPLHPEGDYVPDTLGNRLRERKRLDPEEIRIMLNELLSGLEILHGAGLLHRDIKPDNVLWVDGHAVLGDIGLVTEADKASFAGTRGFISPAVWKGERSYTVQDDLYALGMTLYCALTGNEPKGNLELPLSLTFSGCGDLIRICYAIQEEDSAVHTAADFRALLQNTRNIRRPEHWKWILPVSGVILAGAALCVVLFFQPEPERKAAVTVKNEPATPVQVPPVKKIPVKPASVTDIAKPKAQKSPAPVTVKVQSRAPKKTTPAVNRTLPQRTERPRSVSSRKNPEPQKTPEKENLSPEETLWLKYDRLVRQVENDQPIADSLYPYLRKMEDWYLKHQRDYESTPEPDEQTLQEYKKDAEREMQSPAFMAQKAFLKMRLKKASGPERARVLEQQKSEADIANSRLDQRLQQYRSRYTAYRKISPCRQAMFNYARRKFKADLLKQDLLVTKHHNYVPLKMAKLYEEWCAAYRGLKPLEKKLLPIFDPVELD